MSDPLQFGIIGVGGVGAFHLASILALECDGVARLCAVADPTLHRLPETARDLSARGVRHHDDYRQMLEKEGQLDAVVIATPIPFHDEMTRACIDRGVFVYLEKPPVPLLGQLERLIHDDRDRRVAVGFQMITATTLQRLKQLIVRGGLGEIRTIRACGCWPRRDSYYNRAGWAGKMSLDGRAVFDGPATNAFAHLTHNIMYLAAAGADSFVEPVEVAGELYRARPIESYDIACLRGTFGSGVEFSLAVTHAARELMPFRMEIAGTRGWARLSQDGARVETNVGEEWEHRQTTEELIERAHRQFASSIRDRQIRNSTLLEDTRGYLMATNAMLVSSGGIHAVDSRFVDHYEQDGDAGFDVRGLPGAIEEAFATGRLFSEQQLPWASARPVPIKTSSLLGHDLARFGLPA